MARILEKRAADENDSEMLKLTEAILSRNPDILTLWNIRRECLLKIKEEKSEDETQEIFNQELSFTEICLQANPKSYGAWHQRCWILKNSPEPDWNREVAICTKYLKMDERNCRLNLIITENIRSNANLIFSSCLGSQAVRSETCECAAY